MIARLLDPPPAGPDEGTTPNALALSRRRHAALRRRGRRERRRGVRPLARDVERRRRAPAPISSPAAFRPAGIRRRCSPVGDALIVANGKGRGTIPNPRGPQPQTSARATRGSGRVTTRSTLLDGALMRVPLARDDRRARSPRFTTRVAARERLDRRRARARAIRRSSTSSTSSRRTARTTRCSATCGRATATRRSCSSPRRLAEPPRARRALRLVRPLLRERRGERRRPQLVDGGVRDGLPREDGAVELLGARPHVRLRGHQSRRASRRTTSPNRRAATSGISRSEGHHVPQLRRVRRLRTARRRTTRCRRATAATSRSCARNTNPTYPGLRPRHSRPAPRRHLARRVQAVRRAAGTMPALEIVRLPNDHTSGAAAGTPDAARRVRRQRSRARPHGRGAVAKSPFWSEHGRLRARGRRAERTRPRRLAPVADARDLGVIAARRRSTGSRTRPTCCARSRRSSISIACRSSITTAGRCATSGRARRICDPTRRSRPRVSLDELNPRGTRGARESAKLDLGIEDAADEDLFNQILWRAIKGDATPYPGRPARVSARAEGRRVTRIAR